MSACSARTDRCAPRRSFLVVSSPNQRSTRFIHELEVGVKCNSKRGWASSHCLIAGVLCVLAVVEHQMHGQIGRDLAVDGLQELLELDRAVAGMQRTDDLARREVQGSVEA